MACLPPLGDALHAALASVGVTTDRVSRWLGVPCGCDDRRARLNSLDLWARRVVSGKVGGALEYIERLLSED